MDGKALPANAPDDALDCLGLVDNPSLRRKAVRNPKMASKKSCFGENSL